MRPFQGLKDGLGRAKGLGKTLKKELPRVHKKTKRNRMSKKRRTRKRDKK